MVSSLTFWILSRETEPLDMKLILSVLQQPYLPQATLWMLEPSLGTETSTKWEPDAEGWAVRGNPLSVLGHYMWLSFGGEVMNGFIS